jgi:hypothetical protein
MTTATSLKRMKQQRDALTERIRRAEAREHARRRKDDTRRKILAGAVILEQAAQHETARAELHALLAKFLTRSADRALFNLEPLPPPDKPNSTR